MIRIRTTTRTKINAGFGNDIYIANTMAIMLTDKYCYELCYSILME